MRTVVRWACAALCVALAGALFASAPAFAATEYAGPVASFGHGVDETTGANICTAASKDECGPGEAGAEAAELNGPEALAVNEATGDVYVADNENARIDEFSGSGEFIRAWGWGVGDGLTEALQTCTLTCFKGLAGSGAGQFQTIDAIAVDNSKDATQGDVYVADAGNDRIEKFTASGEYLGQLTGRCEKLGEAAPCSGSTLIPFAGVADATVDSGGSLWVLEREGPGETAHIRVDEFSSEGVSSGGFDSASKHAIASGLVHARAIGVETDGSVLIARGGTGRVFELWSETAGVWSPTSEQFGEREQRATTAIAVNPVTGDIFADEESEAGEEHSSVRLYEPDGHRQIGFTISKSAGVAVDAARPTAPIYLSELERNDVKIFENLPFPTAVTEAAGGRSATTATLQGSVNPEGVPVAECKFEYVEAGEYQPREPDPYERGQSLPCEQGLGEGSGEVGKGSLPVPVSARVAGLTPRIVYHYRLVATDANGTRYGSDRTFFTVTAPVIEAQSVTSIGSTEATLDANIDAAGLFTTYRVEYGPTSAYGSSTADTNLGSSQTSVGAPARLGDLVAGTIYHFRFVVANAIGASDGPDETFTATASSTGAASATSCPNRTYAGFSALLPDCRAYELVSGDAPGEVYVPWDHALSTHEDDISTLLPMQASEDGDAVAFVGASASLGGTGYVGKGKESGVQYMATYAADGDWTTETVSPQAAVVSEAEGPTVFSSFSPDLSVGIFGAGSNVAAHLSLSATPAPPPQCEAIFSRDARGYHALFTSTKQPGSCGSAFHSLIRPGQELRFAGGNEGTATMPSFHSLLLQSTAALTASSEPALEEFEGENLYDSIDGQAYAVNFLPDGELAPDSVFGGPSLAPDEKPDYDRAIAADGSRIFWTDLDTTVGPEDPAGTTRLLAREEPSSSSATTVQLDVPEGGSGQPGGGRYWAASADGSKVIFSDESKLTADSTAEPGMPNLYEYDFGRPLGARLLDLTPSVGAGVQGVVGVSADGSYVYFVAAGALAANQNSAGAVAEARSCEEAEGGLQPGTPSREEELGHLPHGVGCNLYVWHEGTIGFIAALARKDDNILAPGSTEMKLGDWQPELGARTAEVTPDGQDLVFESTQQLTGYDNSVLFEDSHLTGYERAEEAVEVFVYDAISGTSGRIYCASCAPSGAPPQAPGRLEPGTHLPATLNATNMRRWISADGSRVFFDSSQPLAPEAANGAQDVYEWEREGTPGCPSATSASGGCVSLLSAGQSNGDSYFIEADSTGDNVFFAHRGQLAGVGVPEGKMDLFDTRVEGGSPETSLACVGTGCQGVPPAPPAFATPASVTFAGAGNYPAPAPVNSSPKPVKCKRGFVKNKKRKCVRKRSKKSAKRSSNKRRASR